MALGEDIKDEVETEAEMDEDGIVDVVEVDGYIFLKIARRETEK